MSNSRKRARSGKKSTANEQAGQKAGTGSAEKGSAPVAVVGIGASAGGLEALEELFRHLPTDTGMAFIVVMHLHPGHKSLLPELLDKVSELPVVAATHGVSVQADHVYVGPPGGQLSVQDGKLQLTERDKIQSPKMPINYFLRALAWDQKEHAICIILSGTGSDGTLGLQEIKAQGGMVMAQLPISAKYNGMPTSAIATEMVDYQLPPSDMPAQLIKYVRSPHLVAMTAEMPEPAIAAGPLQEIFGVLRRHTGQDFTAYKNNTIYRRIARRMNVHQIQKHEQYARYLQENAAEVDALFRELLINVTSFFRDTEAWESLRVHLDTLISSRPDGSTLRIWVPACSSGEEVFTIGILLKEYFETSKRHTLDVQIFGTDFDSRCIEKARIGSYPEGVADDLTPEILEKYFISENGNYRIRKDIREMAVFAPQNVIKDPPFTEMDLISCRNMLIYFNADVQKKLLPMFHYALKPGGLLFLGSSESIGSYTELLEPVDKRWKIFRREESTTGRQMLPELLQAYTGNPRVSTRQVARLAAETGIQRQIEQVLLGRFAPASVIVNARGDILYVHGRTGAYLEPSEGQPRNNVLEMAREGLQLTLAEAMRQCVAGEAEVKRGSIPLMNNGSKQFIDLSIVMLKQPEALRDLLLVSFSNSSAPINADMGNQKTRALDNGGVEELERALRFMRETQQATLEELYTSNEELESTNEELQSTNEELQSSNEELETSKEEMQSLNEELITVNAELQSKLEDLSQANNDMQNLLNSTKIATVFLDDDLRIKRFTEQARELVMLRQTDVGRPISELASKLQHEDLSADCRAVLSTLVFKEAEVRTSDDAIYLMRIMPYRTNRNAIEGLVITFVDITRLKRTEKELRHMSEVFQDGTDPVIIVDLELRILDLNDEAIRTYGYSRDEITGKSVSKVFPATQQDSVFALIDRCRDGEAIRNVPMRLARRSRDEVPVALTLTVLTTDIGTVDAIAMIARKLNEEGSA